MIYAPETWLHEEIMELKRELTFFILRRNKYQFSNVNWNETVELLRAKITIRKAEYERRFKAFTPHN